MINMKAAAIESNIRDFKGTIVTPDDPQYDTVRKVYNGMIDKHPAMIAVCSDKNDIIACVNYAR